MTQVQDAVIRNIPLKTNQRDRLEIKLVLTGRYMSLARLVFTRKSDRSAHQNQLVLYRPGFAAKAAGQKPARWPRSRGALPSGVTVFANARIN